MIVSQGSLAKLKCNQILDISHLEWILFRMKQLEERSWNGE